MTSLCPGPLFQTSGLNQNSTPTPPTATSSEIDRKLLRQPFNGRDWPRDSPVARVYDVGNTSTSLVLLNRRRKNKCQLRGLTRRNGEIAGPEPRRHIPEEPSVNVSHHKKCLKSSSEPYRPQINLDLGWVNTSQRPPVRFDSGSHVNHRRHTSCRVSGDSPVVGWTGIGRRPLTSSSGYGVDSELQSMSPMLNDPDISQGGRRYLYSIARIYSTSQMKQLKQDQYHQLLFKELNKGYHSPKEYERYLSYLNMPRKTQFGKLDNYEDFRRSKSAPPPAESTTSGRGGESDKGSKKNKRPPFSSRSWASSMISSRASTRQRGGRKKRHASPPQSPRPTDDSQSREPQSPEPQTATLGSDEEDPSDHTRKEESEAGDEPLAGIKETEEDSYKSKDKTSKSDTTPSQKEAEPARIPFTTTAKKDEDGVSPRKENEGVTPRKDILSPRKGEELDTPRTGDEKDGRLLSGKDGQSSEGAPTTTAGAGSSVATSNNFLALIVSDAENSNVGDGSEQEKQSTTAEDTSSTQPPEAGRDFSDMHMASGYTPRKNKEGRTRPLSRAGRGFEEWKGNTQKENSDDDYDDTDEETEKTDTATDKKVSSPPPQQQKKEEEKESVPRSTLEPDTSAVDTSRTDDSKTEERGEMEEPTTVADPDKRATSPEEGSDERAQDSKEAEGQRSLIIPVSERAGDTSATTENVLDLSAESKNRDVDKLEY